MKIHINCRYLPESFFGGVGATRVGALLFSGVGWEVGTGREGGSVTAGDDEPPGTGIGANPTTNFNHQYLTFSKFKPQG